MSDRNSSHTGPLRRRDLAVAAACGVFVATMVGAAFAAVPFYNWFCRATGFQGTTQVATSAPAAVLDRKITDPVRRQCQRQPAVAVRAGPDLDRGQDRRGRHGGLHGGQ